MKELRRIVINIRICLSITRGAMYIFILIVTNCHFSYAEIIPPWKYNGLTGSIYDNHGKKINVRVASIRKIEILDSCDKDYTIFFKTLWLTKYGRKAIIHLLKTNSHIHLSFTDSVGIYRINGEDHFMYAITGPVKSVEFNLIKDYDGGYVYDEQEILISKGSFKFGMGDSSAFLQNRIVVIDYYSSDRKSNFTLDSLNLRKKKHPAADPKNMTYLFKSFKEFIYLTGIHEIHHTRSSNIMLVFKKKDTETPAYQEELKARRKLKKVLKNKNVPDQT